MSPQVSTFLHIPRIDYHFEAAMPSTITYWNLTHIGADIIFFNNRGSIFLLGALWVLFCLLFFCFLLRFLLLFHTPFQLTVNTSTNNKHSSWTSYTGQIFNILMFKHTYISAMNWIHRSDDLKQGHHGKLDPFPRKFYQFPSHISGQTPTCCLHLKLFYLQWHLQMRVHNIHLYTFHPTTPSPYSKVASWEITIPYNLHQNKHLLYVHIEKLWFVNIKSRMHIHIYILAQIFISHTKSPNDQFLPQQWSQVELLKMTVTSLTQNLKWMYTLDICNSFHLCSFLNTTSLEFLYILVKTNVTSI